MVNSGTCFRTPDKVLSAWSESLRRSDVGPAGMRERFDRVWDYLEVAPTPWKVLGASAHNVAKGADKLGLSHRPLDRNAPGCKGSGVCCFGCPTGAKKSMDQSYIPDAVAHGAVVVSHARAQRVLTRGGAAAGVEGVLGGPGGDPVEVRASMTALCCGSLITPVFLENQDLGPRRHRGRHLTVHPAGKIVAEFGHAIRSWNGVPQGYCIDEWADEGIMFEGASVPPEYGAVAFPWAGAAHTAAMDAYDHMDLFGFLISDRGMGRVTSVAGGRPLVTYRAGSLEVDRFVRASALLCEVYLEAGAKRIVAPVHGFDDIRSAADVDALRRAKVRPGDIEVAAFHPLGTCRMSDQAGDGVVDPDLQVHGVDRLYVVDGSVFPSSLGVNPQISIMAFATRAAEHMLHRSGRAGLGPPPVLS
jgi:choline dehydrogenase-like flavoprotein